ncbi:MAG: PAS domain-containing protein, partial [Proteobacteria bacterium]
MPTSTQHSLHDPALHFEAVFNAMPGASGLLRADSPEFTLLTATQEFARFANSSVDELRNLSLFQVFPENPDVPGGLSKVRESLERAISTKQTSEIEIQRYDITDENDVYQQKYWKIVHSPILDERGEVSHIIHTAIDKTDHVLAQARDERIKSLEIAEKLFAQSNVAIHIFAGSDLKITFANKQTLGMWKRDESAIGRPLLEVLPELRDQKYPKIIRNVLETGEPYIAHEAPVMLHRDGLTQNGYFNFILQPYYEDDDPRPAGVTVMVNEVTDIIMSRKALAEKEKSLELAVEIGDLGVFNIDPETHRVDYSPQIMRWFGADRLDLSLTELFKKVHPDDVKLVSDTLRIAGPESTRRHDIVFRVPNIETGEDVYLRSIGQLHVEDGKVISMSGIIQDITNVIRSRQEVEANEQRLRSFIQSAPFPIGIYIGREMRVEMAN